MRWLSYTALGICHNTSEGLYRFPLAEETDQISIPGFRRRLWWDVWIDTIIRHAPAIGLRPINDDAGGLESYGYSA